MKKYFTNSLIVLTVIGLTTSCASIVHGPNQSINFSSQPSGAKIVIDGRDYGVTPRAVELKRKGRITGEASTKKDYTVKIEMEGFYPYELKITREMDGWFLGNLLFGGLIGIIVDASSGAMYKLTPDQVIAQMGKTTAMNVSKADDKIYIAVSLDIDPSWERFALMERAK